MWDVIVLIPDHCLSVNFTVELQFLETKLPFMSSPV